jgi:C4-type Zn-finger protein
MFTYANKMLLVIKRTQANVGQIVQSALEGMNLNNAAKMNQSSATRTGYDEMKGNYEGNKKRTDLIKQIGDATQGQRVIVDLGVIDPIGSSTLIKQQIDLADPNDPDRGITIFMRHGYLTIELMHTPK